jgi:hypothetical protein
VEHTALGEQTPVEDDAGEAPLPRGPSTPDGLPVGFQTDGDGGEEAAPARLARSQEFLVRLFIHV